MNCYTVDYVTAGAYLYATSYLEGSVAFLPDFCNLDPDLDNITEQSVTLWSQQLYCDKTVGRGVLWLRVSVHADSDPQSNQQHDGSS